MSVARRPGRPCEACRHPGRDEIDVALIDPRHVVADISRRFGVSEQSLARHRRDHLARGVMREALAALTTREGLRGQGLVEQAERLRDDALDMRAEAVAAGDRLAAIRASREARACVELLARLAGEVGPDVQVNVGVAILADPSWQQLQSVLLAALMPHEEARRDVLRALERLAA